MTRFLTVAALGLLCCTLPANGDTVYKWQDASGKWHFSDTPPGDEAGRATAAPIKTTNTTSTAATNRELKQVFTDELPAEAAHRRQQQQQQDARRAQLDRWCRQARDRLATIRGRVIFIDADGNPLEVTEDEREQRARALQRQIDRTCS